MRGKRISEILRRFPQLGILAALFLMIVVFSFSSPYFFSWKNIVNIMRQGSTEIIVAMGMTFVLILGGIDLSVGSVACLSGTLTAGMLVNSSQSIFISIIVGLLIGIAAGLINGIVISKFRLPPFIVSLAMMSIARGAALMYCGGRPISNMNNQFSFLGRGQLFGIPITIYIMLFIVLISAVVLKMTKFGKKIYAIGGNEEAARLSGIRITRVKITVYAITGMMAAITGIIYTSRLASSQPTLGEGLELDAIAAVVLGGTSLSGGRGTVAGTFIGGIFLAALANGLNVIGITSFLQQVITGLILILAILIYESTGKRSK